MHWRLPAIKPQSAFTPYKNGYKLEADNNLDEPELA
jgi:hypothetical protein